MQLQGKRIVITGGGSGIGRALAVRFAAEGAAQIIAADLNPENAQETAAMVNGVAVQTDVSDEMAVKSLIEETEANYGPIDLFCSNAGVAMGLDCQSPNIEWQKSWDINVMAHVYAARYMVPKMVARGGGYLLNTASAAGLLNQIGGAAYGVTKHAAVGLAEWLSMTHAHEGLKVSTLCPQAVRTAMTTSEEAEGMSSTKAAANDGMMEPEELAECVVAGLATEQFLILPHPEVLEYMRRKTGDYDRWLAGMNRLHQALSA